MVEPTAQPASTEERYTGGYGPLIMVSLSRRTAAREAAFFLPHLRPGMALLDCGCGPGTMTVELAAVVAPGEVTGVDIEPGQSAAGAALAAHREISNVRFELGSIYRLPFPDASFDAVFAHAVLYHLRDPHAALREMRRVLRPGGVVGIRDSDTGGDLYAPPDPLLDRGWALFDRVVRHNGGNPTFGRMQKAALRDAGFTDVTVSASYDCYDSPEHPSMRGAFWADLLEREQAAVVLEQGWATRDELAAIAGAFRAWDRNPDSFLARARCEAVGYRA